MCARVLGFGGHATWVRSENNEVDIGIAYLSNMRNMHTTELLWSKHIGPSWSTTGTPLRQPQEFWAHLVHCVGLDLPPARSTSIIVRPGQTCEHCRWGATRPFETNDVQGRSRNRRLLGDVSGLEVGAGSSTTHAVPSTFR